MISAVAFLVFCAVCTVLGFVRHPIYALYFYLGTIFVFPPARWWGSYFGETRWALVSAAITMLAIAFHRGKLKPRPAWILNVPAIVMVCYAAWMWIQVPWAKDFDTHIEGSLKFVKYIVAFWFVYRVADTKEHARDVLFAHMLGCAVLGVFAFFAGRDGDRLDGVGGPGIDDANTLGMYLATGAVTAMGLLLTEKGWRRWTTIPAAVMMLQGLVLTNTRGALLGMLGGVAVLMLFKAKAHRRIFWALAIVGLVGFASIVDQKFIDRMWTIRDSTVDSEDVDQSARSRIIIARAQWQMFLDYPLGTGHRGTAALSTLYMEERWLTRDADGSAARSSHNTFMTALSEQGVPGALLFIWLTIWTGIAMFRLRALEAVHGDPQVTTLAATAGAALTVVLVAGNTADFLMAELQFWVFAVLVALQQMRVPDVVGHASAQPPVAVRPLPTMTLVTGGKRHGTTSPR